MRKLLFVIVLAGITANYAFPRSIDEHDKSGDDEPKVYVYTIVKTWNGKNIPEEEGVGVSLQAVRGTRDIVFRVDAPYYNDPPPDGDTGQPLLGLWNYEVVEIYFLNDADQYLEVEIGPHGHHIVLLLNGQRNTIRHSLPLEVDTSIIGSRWTAKAVIPGDYFPPKISKLNVHSMHGYAENRRHLALYPADGTTKEPDPHNLSFFQPFNISIINPEHQDYHELSQLWEDSIQGRSEHARRIFKYKITRQWNNFRSKIPATTASLQGFQGGVEVNFTMPVNDEKFPAESFVAIFENGQKESLKVQLFVDGHFSVEFFNNRKTKLNQQNFPLDYRVGNRIPRYVKGSVMIPPSYFPPKVNLLNMYALFGVETMLAMTLRAMEIRPGIDFTPNLSNIEHFVSIDFDLLVESKDEYSEMWRRLLNLAPLQSHNADVNDGGEIGVDEAAQGSNNDVEETKLMKKESEKDEGSENPEGSPLSNKRIETHYKETSETEGKDLEADSKSDQEGEVAITEAGVSALPDEAEAKSEDDVRFSLPAILLGESITDSKSNTWADRSEDDVDKIIRKDQVHFNKPLRFLLRKYQDPTAIEKEDFNPLREMQEHESLKEEEKREFPKAEEGPVKDQAQEEGSIALHENKKPELATVRMEEEEAYTTEKDSLVEEEERLYTKEALLDEERAPSTEKEEQSPSERPEELATTSRPREEEPAEEGPTEQEEQSIIEREKHQRRYEESSNRNELPITFKITFEPKTPFEDLKKEVEDVRPPEDLPDVDYSLLDEPPPIVIENSGALPPPHPICFTEGLVPDHFRCQVFYECVLEDGRWAVYNWRCKRGTYYDPVKVACIKGYC